MQPQQKAVVAHDPAAQRLAQSSRRRLDAWMRENGQLAGISFACDQSLWHRAAGHADDVGNHRTCEIASKRDPTARQCI